MVELRWVLRAGLGRVLQTRHVTNPLEAGLHPPIWSEWKDVPVVVGP